MTSVTVLVKSELCKEEFGERVRSCYYSSRPMTPYEYEKRDNNRSLIFMCVVDRTTYVERTIEAIKNKEVSLPYRDESLAWVARVVLSDILDGER